MDYLLADMWWDRYNWSSAEVALFRELWAIKDHGFLLVDTEVEELWVRLSKLRELRKNK